MRLSKFPKHIWWGVLLPIVLVGLGIWRLWPWIEEYRAEEERKAINNLIRLTIDPNAGNTGPWWRGRINGYGVGIDLQVVNAKRVPQSLPTPEYAPTNGYYFVTIRNESSPESTEVDPGNMINLQDLDSNPSRILFCAYPSDYDWRHRRTFFWIKDGNHFGIFGLDNGGKPILEWSKESKLAEEVDMLGAWVDGVTNP